jgi:hypothetical protein
MMGCLETFSTELISPLPSIITWFHGSGAVVRQYIMIEENCVCNGSQKARIANGYTHVDWHLPFPTFIPTRPITY